MITHMQAAIFDLDGVIVDTARYHYLAWKRLANQLGLQFAHLDCTPRWRERLGELAMPTLVVHGRRDPFFPLGNGEALARAIPASRLLVLDDMSTALREAATDEVATAMLAL